MRYTLTNGERTVTIESSIHRDAYISSGWRDVPTEKIEQPVIETAEEVEPDETGIEAPKRRGRPRKE